MKTASLRHKMYLVVLTVMYLSCVSVHGLATLYLSCGATITFGTGKEVILQLSKTGTYWSNADCDTVVETQARERLALKLTDISLSDCGDSLTLYDTAFDTVLYSHNCTSPAPVHGVTTSGDRTLLKFTSNAIGNNGHFSLLMTSFTNASTASCDPDNSFKCNNSRCILSDLSCNTRDNCGDNSDEANCAGDDDEYDVAWIIILGITGAIVLVVFIIGFKLTCDQKAKDKAAKAKRNNETPAPSTSRASDSDSQSSQTNIPPQQNSPQAVASAGTRNKNSRKKKRGTVGVSTSTQTDTPPSAPPSDEQVPPTTNTIFQPPGNSLTPVTVPTVQPSVPGALPMGTPVLVHVVPVPQLSDEAPPSYESVMAGEQPPVTTRTDRFLPQNTNSTSPMYPPQGVYVIAVPPAEPSNTQPPAYTPPENNHN